MTDSDSHPDGCPTPAEPGAPSQLRLDELLELFFHLEERGEEPTTGSLVSGLARYEPPSSRGHHDHLICRGCGRIVEFENDQIESLQEKVARRHGFIVTDHRMELYGVCGGCREAAG